MTNLQLLVDVLSWILMGAGLFFIILGLVGIYKMPDVYMKQHASGLIDTAGTFLICLALTLQSGLHLVAFKPILLSILAALISAPMCYAFIQIAIRKDKIIHNKNEENIDVDSLNQKINNRS